MRKGVHNVWRTTSDRLPICQVGESRGKTAGNRPCEGCGENQAKPGQFYCSDDCRFNAKFNKGPACWLWTGYQSGGRKKKQYGHFTVQREGKLHVVRAHVYAYIRANGPVPEGMEVMHRCHTRLCVRPEHLKAGTHAENVKDSAAMGHYNVPHPSIQKLTPEHIQEIHALRREGWTMRQIASEYDVSAAYISMLVAGKRRQHTQLIPALEQAG